MATVFTVSKVVRPELAGGRKEQLSSDQGALLITEHREWVEGGGVTPKS